ncbi:DegT/DnrJ/EryC1/StrS family aminotransferase [Virgibacillus proomii]|uniref:DegT/DnrJ/EryC1/StrS family aminotransferase n=1 Tax=Virgibacillus proomii TaxID=84407 RepID=UPI001C0F3D7B|nr:DegT/DnrJ/EryC1/StrS family aminotransferase [Virgibacillus proomii]
MKGRDYDPVYGSLTLDEVKRLQSDKTKTVVVVHISGIVAPEIFEIINLIEDAAHAVGYSYREGYLGDMR